MPHHQTPNTAIPTKTHAESQKTHQGVTSQEVLGGLALVFLALAVLGLIPFRLPGPMYPEWQLERRRRRAQEAARANRDHEDGGVASWGRHAARPESTTDVGGHDGQHAGETGGEDPLT